MTVEEYRNLEALNYSTLSALDSNPENIIAEDKDFSDAMKIGDAVDILMFTPEVFDNKYIVADVEQPTAQLLELVNEAHQKNYNGAFEVEILDNETINDKYRFFVICKKEDVRKAKWDNDLFWNYLKFLKNSESKHIISIDEDYKIKKAVEVLKNHPFTKDIFGSKLEIKTQWVQTFEYGGYKYKCLLDIVLIDHENKIIYPYDLKVVSSGIYSFLKQMFKFKYYIQSSLYRHALIENYPDYQIMDFKDIVYSTVDEKPLIFNMKNFHDKSRDGWEENGRVHKGWLELSENYYWHKENDKWKYPKDVYVNNGEIIVN